MSKPPTKKTTGSVVKTALRLPSELHAELHEAAEINGRSLNAEIVFRLQANPLHHVERQNDEIKLMLRQLLDRM